MKFRLKSKEIEATQWTPGIRIPGVRSVVGPSKETVGEVYNSAGFQQAPPFSWAVTENDATLSWLSDDDMQRYYEPVPNNTSKTGGTCNE